MLVGLSGLIVEDFDILRVSSGRQQLIVYICSTYGLIITKSAFSVIQAALKTIGEEDKYFSRVSLRYVWSMDRYTYGDKTGLISDCYQKIRVSASIELISELFYVYSQV